MKISLRAEKARGKGGMGDLEGISQPSLFKDTD